MTSATGANRSRRCAFTLVEMILVLALLVIAVSMVAPRLSGFIRGRALDSEARRLLAVTHAGQARAVSEGQNTMLWLDEKSGNYGLELETPGQNGDAKAENFTADDNVQFAVVSSGVNAATTFNNVPAIRFMPDGAADENSPQTVRLQDSGGGIRWLMLTQGRKSYEIRDTDK